MTKAAWNRYIFYNFADLFNINILSKLHGHQVYGSWSVLKNCQPSSHLSVCRVQCWDTHKTASMCGQKQCTLIYMSMRQKSATCKKLSEVDIEGALVLVATSCRHCRPLLLLTSASSGVAETASSNCTSVEADFSPFCLNTLDAAFICLLLLKISLNLKLLAWKSVFHFISI